MRISFTPVLSPHSIFSAVLLSLLLVITVTAKADSTPDDELDGAHQMMSASPRVQALAEDEARFDVWKEEIYCALYQSGPPGVRMLITSAPWQQNAWQDRCPAWVDKPDLGTFRKKGLADGWNNPGVILNSYLGDCVRPQPRDWCDYEAMQAQMRSLEPDNAISHLMPLLRPLPVISDLYIDESKPGSSLAPSRQWAKPDPEVIRTAILAASRSEQYNEHAHDGIYDLYLEVSSLAEIIVPPRPSPELEALWGTEDFAWPAYLTGMFTVMAAGNDGALIFLSTTLAEYCEQAHNDRDMTLLQACLELSRLMQGTSTSVAGMTLGLSLERRLTRPAGVPITRDFGDWRYQIGELVRICEMPKKLFTGPWTEGVPEDHLKQHVQDLQSLGEPKAMRRTAAREYAAHPEAFAIDPQKCRDALTLPEAQQQALVEMSWIEDSGDTVYRRGPALKALAEILNDQDLASE